MRSTVKVLSTIAAVAMAAGLSACSEKDTAKPSSDGAAASRPLTRCRAPRTCGHGGRGSRGTASAGVSGPPREEGHLIYFSTRSWVSVYASYCLPDWMPFPAARS